MFIVRVLNIERRGLGGRRGSCYYIGGWRRWRRWRRLIEEFLGMEGRWRKIWWLVIIIGFFEIYFRRYILLLFEPGNQQGSVE